MRGGLTLDEGIYLAQIVAQTGVCLKELCFASPPPPPPSKFQFRLILSFKHFRVVTLFLHNFVKSSEMLSDLLSDVFPFRMPLRYWHGWVQSWNRNWGRSDKNCQKYNETNSNLAGQGKPSRQSSITSSRQQQSFKWITEDWGIYGGSSTTLLPKNIYTL